MTQARPYQTDMIARINAAWDAGVFCTRGHFRVTIPLNETLRSLSEDKTIR